MMPGVIQGKVWGTTQRLFDLNNVIIERAFLKKGWRCSDHIHKNRFNLFYVESGKVLVRTHKDGLDDETVLLPQQTTVVKPGDRHRFEALADSVIYEIYWVTIDPADIVRYDSGQLTGTRDTPRRAKKCGSSSKRSGADLPLSGSRRKKTSS